METSSVASRSSYAAESGSDVGSASLVRPRIFMASGPSRRSESRPGLDVLRVEAARNRIGLGDDAVLDQGRERLLEGQHAVAPPRDQGVAQLVRLAFLHQVSDRGRGDE